MARMKPGVVAALVLWLVAVTIFAAVRESHADQPAAKSGPAAAPGFLLTPGAR